MDICFVIRNPMVIADQEGYLTASGHWVDYVIGHPVAFRAVERMLQLEKPDVVILYADSVRFGDDRCIIALAKELCIKIVVYGFDKTLAQVVDGSLPWPIYSPEELVAEIERVMGAN